MPNNILNSLWNNWMFRLSLSSNELFHSNFLQAALSDPLPDMIDEHAGASSWDRVQDLATWAGLDAAWLAERQAAYGEHPVFVYREWKNLDLAIVVRAPLPNQGYREIVIFAVELKVKSYPTLEQVQRYLRLMASHNGDSSFVPRLVLLSLVTPPAHFDMLDHVNIMNFGQLADGIQDLAPAQLTMQPAIDEYALLCQLLHQLSSFWSDNLNGTTPLHAVTGQVKLYRRLNPIWSKLCAAYLCELVRQEMEDFVLDSGIELLIVPDFSRSTWKADFLWRTTGAADARDVTAMAGVQVEGNTIRFMLNAQNVGGRVDNARLVVQETLLAQADASGLYKRLHQLYEITTATHAEQVAEVASFWQRASGLKLTNGMPIRGQAKGDYRLPGYNNSLTFGHADYRLTLRQDATLDEISQLVCAALRGDYNANGPGAFVEVLNNPDVF